VGELSPETTQWLAPAPAPVLAPPAPGDLVEPTAAHHHAPSHATPRPPRPRRLAGRFALAAAILMVVLVAGALAIDAPGRYLAATVLAVAADVLSLLAVILGIVAIVRRSSRGAGIAALVVAVLGNPLVLLYGLAAIT
jgi:hypothetical protein